MVVENTGRENWKLSFRWTEVVEEGSRKYSKRRENMYRLEMGLYKVVKGVA